MKIDLKIRHSGFKRVVFASVVVLALSACHTVPKVPDEMMKQINATDCSQDQCIDFIYLHGSRPAETKTAQQEHDTFDKQVDAMHSWIMAELYNRPEAHEGLLQQDQWRINPEPVRFYWGDMSAKQFDILQDQLDWSHTEKGKPGSLVNTVQKLFVTGLHDTFWVSKFANSRKINLAINDAVMKSTSKGRNVVLLGHSAGALAIQNYGLFHWRYVDIQELRSRQTSKEVRQALRGVRLKTCIRAMLESGFSEISSQGEMVPRLATDTMTDMGTFRRFRRALWAEKLKILPEYTEKYCAPSKGIVGLITYGNPGLVVETMAMTKKAEMLLFSLRYVMENNLFWMNINHIKDPLGYSVYDGLDIEQVLEKRLGIEIVPRGGFFISGIGEGGAGLAMAHSWYWYNPSEFANTLANIYAEGFKNRIQEAD